MDRVYQANAIETPPSTTASSGSYPTAGNKASGQLATVPGPYWFYSITEEIRNALIAAGITPDAAKVNQLAEAMAKFLPLSGGTMTGDISLTNGNYIKNTVDTGWTHFLGGATFETGGRIQIAGKDNSSYKGEVWIVPNDGTNAPPLKLLPNGSATWNGKNLVRSVNNTSADANGNVTISAGNLSSSAYAANSYCKLSNGLQFVYGSYSSAEDNTKTITFARAFKSAPKVIMTCQSSNEYSLNGAEGVMTVSATQVKIYNGGAVSDVHWLAIGEGS